MDPTADLASLLHPFSPDELGRYPDSVYAVDHAGRLFYVNAAWRAFAAANGGEPAISDRWSLGADVFSAIALPLQRFYRDLFAAASEVATALRRPADHTYECSTPDLFRRFQMSVYPLAAGRGFLVVNALLVERPHDPQERPSAPPGDAYLDAQGMLHQCCHCRRMSNQAHPGRWDWVPAWVERFPPSTSHTLCGPCLAFYYSPRAPESR